MRWMTLGGALAGILVGCGTPATPGTPDAGTPDAGTPVSQDVCTDPTPVACEDQVIQNLNLQRPVAPGLITNKAEEPGWYSVVDATAGGFNADPPTSYVYAKFSDTGLEKVELGDEDALASMDWDIAFRRFVIRLNGADSGPSCVGAARLPSSETYENVTEAPSDLSFRMDDDFSDACTLIDDGSGLGSSPGTALSGYYKYDPDQGSCVAMTGHVYIVQLRTGKLLKLKVTQYYGSGQDQCDQGVGPGTTSAKVGLHWAFL